MLTVKSYLLPTASGCNQRLSKGSQNVSIKTNFNGTFLSQAMS